MRHFVRRALELPRDRSTSNVAGMMANKPSAGSFVRDFVE
jgi:hypothetical protein